jgi:hypothetical protein
VMTRLLFLQDCDSHTIKIMLVISKEKGDKV